MMNPLDAIIEFLVKTQHSEVGIQLLDVFKQYAVTLEEFDTLGRLYHDTKDYTKSAECAQHVVRLSTNTRQRLAALSNLAKVYNHLNEPFQALQCLEEIAQANPANYEVKMEMLFSYYLAADFEQSRVVLDSILADPNAPKHVQDRCRFNLGSYLLDEGDFKTGLRGFIDIGHQIGIWQPHTPPFPIWSGEKLPGKTVAILTEGGIGDEVVNIRFAKIIRDEYQMRPVLVTSREATASLFKRNGYDVCNSTQQLPTDSVAVKLFYLPIVLDLDQDQLWNGPYLKPDAEYVDKWKQILPAGRPLVGIRWRGNPLYDQDLHRSIPLAELNNVLRFDRDDVTFVSLQKEHNEELADYPHVFDCAPYLETLEDLLACMSLLNHTVTSCTSVAHIGAAAGLPITVCPPVATYYTWLGDAKWYGDNCTILRQRKWRDWSHLQQLETILKGLV